MRKSKVSIVILNYNCFDDTVRCIESIRECSFLDYEIILVDGASSDGSGELLMDKFGGDLEFIQAEKNLGFAFGNNLGIKRALEIDSKYIWLLNPDTTIDKDALNALVTFFSSNNYSILGSAIYYPIKEGDSRKTWGIGGFLDNKRCLVNMGGEEILDKNKDLEVIDCDYVPGCSLFFSADLIKEIGFLPEDYFMYFEETDWCNGAKKTGHKLGIVLNSIVYHHFKDQKQLSDLNVYYYTRNELLFWFRNLPLVLKIKFYLAVLFKRLPRVNKAIVASREAAQLRAFEIQKKAFIDFLCFRYGKSGFKT